VSLFPGGGPENLPAADQKLYGTSHRTSSEVPQVPSSPPPQLTSAPEEGQACFQSLWRSRQHTARPGATQGIPVTSGAGRRGTFWLVLSTNDIIALELNCRATRNKLSSLEGYRLS